jgi:hypothetical protein
MAIRQSAGSKRILLRQRNLPAPRADLVRRHMGGPGSSNPLGDTGYELEIGGLLVRGGPIRHRLLRLERRYEAEERGLSRPERRSRVPQPDLVLLLVRVREEANIYTATTHTNARAANGDTDTAALSCATYFHAHAGTLSSTVHTHTVTLVEQLTGNVPERNACQGSAFACPEAGGCLFVENSVKGD